jgi:hypothetical protein
VYRPNVPLALFAAAALAACAQHPPEQLDQASSEAVATSPPSAAVTASPAPRHPHFARVVAFATAAPSPTPSPAATPSAAPSPAPRKRVVVPMRAPNAPPQIVDVEVNSTNVGSGDTLWGKVLTSSNVASVEVRVADIGVGLNKVGVGRFTLAYRLGSIPFFVRGTYPMHIIARNSRGDTAERTLPLTIH